MASRDYAMFYISMWFYLVALLYAFDRFDIDVGSVKHF